LVRFAQLTMNFYSKFAVLTLISAHIVTAEFKIEYPTVRFTEYAQLTAVQQNATDMLGYNPSTWNNPGTRDFELLPWWYHTFKDYYDLNEDEEDLNVNTGDDDEIWRYYNETNEIFLQNAGILGFSRYEAEDGWVEAEDIWDCWMTHYDYEWEDIEEYQLNVSAIVLGWNQTLWESDPPEVPESSSKSYADLTDEEREAAEHFCYTKDLWDYEQLPFALETGAPNPSPTEAPNPSPTDEPIEPTNAPVEPTIAPVDPPTPSPTDDRIEPTNAPVEPTIAPVDPPTPSPTKPRFILRRKIRGNGTEKIVTRNCGWLYNHPSRQAKICNRGLSSENFLPSAQACYRVCCQVSDTCE